jgi:hypothetical protein
VGVIPLADIRPDEWNLPLFLHVLGAFALIGALALTAAFLLSAWRDGSAASVRLGLRSLLLGVIPAWIVLRGSAEWIADKEGYADLDDPPAWIDIGYGTGDISLLFILVSSLLAWTALRKARAGGAVAIRMRIAVMLVGLLLAASLVALWAMTTKPS